MEFLLIMLVIYVNDICCRAIYRWITYKDLNAIQFSETGSDSPMGLLRGIKFGTETYHTLFKRLCRLVYFLCGLQSTGTLLSSELLQLTNQTTLCMQ